MKILLVEDNIALSKNIVEYLELKWMKVETDYSWTTSLPKIINNHYDVVILDINLPWMDWLTMCQELRKIWNNTPILMLTSRNTTQDIVKWLNFWADDYLGKPFDFEELISRIEALYRRTASFKSSSIVIDNVEIDITKRIVKKDWIGIELSNLEFNLLKYLAQNRGRPIDRVALFENVWWDFDEHMLSRSVDMYISYLRKKLWNNFIETKKWFWYMIK